MRELAEFIRCPLEAIEGYDVAALNLRALRGFPARKTWMRVGCSAGLTKQPRELSSRPGRHWYRFNEAPSTYHNSAAYFCCYFLLQTLQEDLGVRYNPARIRDTKFQDPKCFDPDFRDSCDLFIHGIIDGPGGTCASMPVMYVAVGRRLGYPLKLVQTRAICSRGGMIQMESASASRKRLMWKEPAKASRPMTTNTTKPGPNHGPKSTRPGDGISSRCHP